MLVYALGSRNPVKVHALRFVMRTESHLGWWAVLPVKTESGVDEQPRGLKAITEGASIRASAALDWLTTRKRAQGSPRIGVGLESGIIRAPGVIYDLCACVFAFEDGTEASGLSGGFVVPRSVTKFLRGGRTLGAAAKMAGLTKSSTVGRREGLIGLLSRNRITRRDQTIQAIKMAMVDGYDRIEALAMLDAVSRKARYA